MNATADSSNRLVSAAQGTLLTHDGAGHQLKVNKANAGDTASLLLQDGFSGHAEMGLAGNNNFNVKVSPDGNTFNQALAINSASAITNATCITSSTIVIAKDSVGTIPTPSKSGFVMILDIATGSGNLSVPRIGHSGIIVYDTGTSEISLPIFLILNLENHGITTMTGTTSAVGITGVSVQQNAITSENRMNGNRTYSYTFFGGA